MTTELVNDCHSIHDRAAGNRTQSFGDSIHNAHQSVVLELGNQKATERKLRNMTSCYSDFREFVLQNLFPSCITQWDYNGALHPTR